MTHRSPSPDPLCLRGGTRAHRRARFARGRTGAVLSLAVLPVLLVIALAGCGSDASPDATRDTGRRGPASTEAGPSPVPPAPDSSVAGAEVTSPSAADSTRPSGAPKQVTIVLDWTPNTNHSGIYLAKANGYYEAAGLDVTIIEPGADGGLPLLATGKAQFAVTSAEYVLPARAAGAPVVSVAAVLAHNTSSLVVPKDRAISSPKQLAGAKYGGFGGDLEKALIDELVRCDGGDPSKVSYVAVGNVDYAVGLGRRDYDAVWIFDGWDGIRLAQAGLETVSFPFHPSCLPDWYTPVIAAGTPLLERDPALVRAFLAATAKGYELARAEPATAVTALTAAAPELDRKLVEASAAWIAGRYADPGRPWGTQDPAVWSAFTAFLVEHHLLDAKVTADEAFSNAFLPQMP